MLVHGNPVPKRDSDHHSLAYITELRSNCYDNTNVAGVQRQQGQPRVHDQDIEFGPALANNGRNVLKIAERVLLVKMLDIRNVIFQISIICICFST